MDRQADGLAGHGDQAHAEQGQGQRQEQPAAGTFIAAQYRQQRDDDGRAAD
jgi:hypothetical protein